MRSKLPEARLVSRLIPPAPFKNVAITSSPTRSSELRLRIRPRDFCKLSAVDRCGSSLQRIQERVFFKRPGLVGRYELLGNVFRFQRVRVVAEQAARVLKNLLKFGDFLRLEHTKSAGSPRN